MRCPTWFKRKSTPPRFTPPMHAPTQSSLHLSHLPTVNYGSRPRRPGHTIIDAKGPHDEQPPHLPVISEDKPSPGLSFTSYGANDGRFDKRAVPEKNRERITFQPRRRFRVTQKVRSRVKQLLRRPTGAVVPTKEVTAKPTEKVEHITSEPAQQVEKLTLKPTEKVEHAISTPTDNVEHGTPNPTEKVDHVTPIPTNNAKPGTPKPVDHITHEPNETADFTSKPTEKVKHITHAPANNVDYTTPEPTDKVELIIHTQGKNLESVTPKATENAQGTSYISITNDEHDVTPSSPTSEASKPSGEPQTTTDHIVPAQAQLSPSQLERGVPAWGMQTFHPSGSSLFPSHLDYPRPAKQSRSRLLHRIRRQPLLSDGEDIAVGWGYKPSTHRNRQSREFVLNKSDPVSGWGHRRRHKLHRRFCPICHRCQRCYDWYLHHCLDSSHSSKNIHHECEMSHSLALHHQESHHANGCLCLACKGGEPGSPDQWGIHVKDCLCEKCEHSRNDSNVLSWLFPSREVLIQPLPQLRVQGKPPTPTTVDNLSSKRVHNDAHSRNSSSHNHLKPSDARSNRSSNARSTRSSNARSTHSTHVRNTRNSGRAIGIGISAGALFGGGF